MRRKFLEDLGLEKDVIDQIMSEHGAGVTAPHFRPILSRKTKEPMRATSVIKA